MSLHISAKPSTSTAMSTKLDIYFSTVSVSMAVNDINSVLGDQITSFRMADTILQHLVEISWHAES